VRSFLVLVLLSAVFWGGMAILPVGIDAAGAAFAKGGSSGSSHDDDDDDDDSHSGGSGSGGSGSGSSGSGSSGSGGSGSGSSGSGGSGSGGSGSGASAGYGSDASREGAVFGREGLTVRYADGHVERVRGGLFESLDPRGRVVASHAAQRDDVERLQSLGASAKRRGGSRAIEAIVEIGASGSTIEVTDYRGWRETVTRGAYVVTDPDGRTVIRRPVTAGDIARLREMLRLD
jgi:hypothetical protein